MPRALAWLLQALVIGAVAGAAASAAQAQAQAQVPAQVQAQRMPEQPGDLALEARVMAVAEELRCLVCQNETIAASHADLAKDLRAQIRSQLQQGQSPAQVLDFMVSRYGEFVLYRPPLKASTLALWGGPFVLLLAAGGWLVLRLRQGARHREATLSPEELRRVQQLMEGERAR